MPESLVRVTMVLLKGFLTLNLMTLLARVSVVISALSISPLDRRYSEISLLDISDRKPAKRNETVSLIAKLKAAAKANVKLVRAPARAAPNVTFADFKTGEIEGDVSIGTSAIN